MAEQQYTWTPAQFAAHKVFVAHQRKDIGGCLCGWGDATGQLGRSHAEHVIDELSKAGVFGGPRQHGTIDQLARDAEAQDAPAGRIERAIQAAIEQAVADGRLIRREQP